MRTRNTSDSITLTGEKTNCPTAVHVKTLLHFKPQLGKRVGVHVVYVKELHIFLTMKVLEDTPAVLSLGKLCDEHGHSYEWIDGHKPHLIKIGIRIQCNRENFVPIVVRGLSTSSSSNLPSSTTMTPSRQEIDHPTSSSSSSTSPTMTSSTVSSDDGTRARGDLCGIDSYPVTVSSKHVERKER